MSIKGTGRSGLLVVVLFEAIMGLTCVAFGAVPADRISGPISSANLTRLKGNIHPLTRTATETGGVDGSTPLERMKLVFQLTSAQQNQLDVLLAQQQDPTSPNYHKWLTPERYGDRFGLSQGDVAKIASWLQSQGFSIAEIARSRTYIAFNGTAAQVEAAFHTQIHQYNLNGKLHYANATEPSIPAALAGIVSGISALHNFGPKPRLVKPNPRVTSSVTGNHFMQPGDFATIYDLTGLYSSGIDGTGQSIAVVGVSDLVTDNSGNYTDVVTFRTNSGLPTPPNLTTVHLPNVTDPGVVSTDIDEASLDVEWSGGVAKNAKIIFVVANQNTGNGVFDALVYAVSNNLAPVISISYGNCESQIGTAELTALTNAGMQANAQGQTIVAPAGDAGAADCESATSTSATTGLAVDFPGSMPYATSAGGSEFIGDAADSASPCAATQFWSGGQCTVQDTNATAVFYGPESVWNDTNENSPPTLSAGGGGLSTIFTQPTWQGGLSVITNGKRGVPDISLSASDIHDGYLICSQGSCGCGFRSLNTTAGETCNSTNPGTYDSIGGTSTDAPSFAAIVALINQKVGAPQGNVNPMLYSLATTSPNAFHDITTGNNMVPCTSGSTDCPAGTTEIGYSAGTGYDLASGWGSVDAGALVSAWGQATPSPDFTIAAASESVTINSGASTTVALTITAVNGFAGNVAFPTCPVPTVLGATTCSVSPSTVAPGTQATLTITTLSGLTSGLFGTLVVTGTSGNLSHNAYVVVTVQTVSDFTITAAPTSLTLTTGMTGSSAISVAAVNGLSANVSLSCSVGSTLGATTCTVSPQSIAPGSTATLTVVATSTLGRLRTPILPFHRGWAMGSSLAFAAGFVFLYGKQPRSRRKRGNWRVLLGMTVVSLLALTVSCGGGGSSSGGGGTTPLSGNVIVTGTSGSLSHSATVAVTIN